MSKAKDTPATTSPATDESQKPNTLELTFPQMDEFLEALRELFCLKQPPAPPSAPPADTSSSSSTPPATPPAPERKSMTDPKTGKPW